MTKAERERGPGSDFHYEATAMGRIMAARSDVFDDGSPLPDPMPARDANGERIFLHYRPLRWLREP